MKLHLLKKLELQKVKKMSKFDQLIFGLIGLGALVVIIFLITLIYMNWPQPSVATLLPADNTVTYIEVNSLKLPTKLEAGENKVKLAESLGQPFGMELLPALEALGSDGLAFALVKDQSRNQPFLFIKTKTKRGALNYFKSLTLPNEELVKTADKNPRYYYPQGQPFAFMFIKKYVVIAQTPDILILLDNLNEKTLSENEDYIKSINNLPRRSWILGYVDFKNLTFSDNPAVNSIIEPMKHAIRHMALAVRKDQEGFHFNTFLNLNKDLLSLERGESSGKFSYELTNYIPEENVALYIGGANLEAEWLNTLETISNLNPAYGVILEGMVRAQTNEVFGSQVDLRNDIYPLFQGEYALSVGTGKTGKEISLILSHQDRSFAEKKLEKLAQGFRFLAAKFAPKVVVVQLPDGTESRELVPDTGKLEETEEKIEGYDVHCIVVSDTAAGFCYSATDEIIIMTNSKERLIETLDIKDTQLLSDSASFRKSLANLSKVSDEVTYINFDNFYSLTASNQYIQALQPLLSKLEAASYVKHYFTDGVSSEGYILVK
ncbi:DUF3352 domain-containing protein [Candidatus Peregrinibacteria bacterium]|nr:DUF3352 domain-containing protein [Candidatus Peregrinibacteria bacterium]